VRDLREFAPAFDLTAFAVPFLRAFFDPKPLQQKLNRRARGFADTLEEELERAGRLIAVSLARSTQPYGDSVLSRHVGESATAGDIHRCYATPGDVFAAFPDKRFAGAFWAAIKKGNFGAAQKIMQRYCPQFSSKEIKPFDGGAAHKGARNNRGRVSKKQDPIFVVKTTRDLNAYVQDEVDHVGEGKAGWAGCAKILGGMRGIPQWVTRHAGKLAGSFVGKDYRAEVKTITLENQVRYAQDILDPGDKAEAVKIGIDRLAKSIFIAETRAGAAHPLS